MNLIETFISAEFTRAFAWTLFHSLWQGGLIALMAAVVITLLKRHKPELRYTILCVLLFMLPVLFAGTFIYYYSQGSQVAVAVKADSTNAVLQTDLLGEHIKAYSSNNPSMGWRTLTYQTIEKQSGVFFLIWMIGFLFFLMRFAGSIFLVHRLKTGKNYQLGLYWEDRLKELSAQLKLRKPVRLLESALAKVPMTIGYLKPVILLPIGTISGVPPLQIEAILLHELAHILRKDYLVNILQSIIELLFFYHPATWWISGLIRQEREHICDDLAVNVNHDHINYIKALTIMEELNANSPVLVSAMAGSKKKLLGRVKRLISPGKIRKGTSEGIIVFLVIIGLISVLSLNALSTIPDSYDLTGRESGERIVNLLPYNPNPIEKPEFVPVTAWNPDSIVSTSKSGKVTVKVYTDTVDSDTEKNLQVIVERLDDQLSDTDHVNREYRKEVIIKKKGSGGVGSTEKVIIIKSGDSLTVFNNDTILVLPEDYDTTFTADGGIGFYEFETSEIPEYPDLINGPEIQYYIFQEDQKAAQEEFERALRDQEFDMKEFERQHRELEKEMSRNMIIVENPEDMPHEWIWAQRTPEPEPGISQAEKIIRQELRDDGLTERGRKYVIELDARAMYINGEKQPKEIFKKYKKLVEGLEQTILEGTQSYKLIF